MNTVTLDNNTYGLAANYANLHNVSISDAVKAGIQMLVGKTNQQSIKSMFALYLNFIPVCRP